MILMRIVCALCRILQNAKTTKRVLTGERGICYDRITGDGELLFERFSVRRDLRISGRRGTDRKRINLWRVK